MASPGDLCELDSVKVTEPMEAQTCQNCNESSDHTFSARNESNVLAFLKRNALTVLTVVAVSLGIGLGFALRHINLSAREIKYLTFPGELLMRMLQMLVLPLTVSSLIAGVSSVDKKVYGKVGLRVFTFYMVTTVIAIFTGIALALLIQPGNSSRASSVSSSGVAGSVQTMDSILDLIRNMFPSNLIEACFKTYKTVYVSPENSLGVINMTDSSGNFSRDDREPVESATRGINMLGLLIFSVAFGLTLGSLGTKGQPLRDLFHCLNRTIMQLVNVVIWYSPVGTIFLLSGQIVKITDPNEIGHEVAMYTVTVITGLLIHSLITLPFIYFMVTRKNPFRFMGGLAQALITAFGTSSSSATLPITIHCIEENRNMDKKLSHFMLPIGATMNMDGAALYEAVAALFIAQINNIEFNLGQIIVLSLVVTAGSTGAAGIAQSGMVIMLMVLASVGLPPEDISLLLIVDWFLDRLRTVTNVLGDCIGVGVVQHLSQHDPEWSSSVYNSYDVL